MSKIKNAMSRDDNDEIFGVKEVPGFSTNSLELRYEVEYGQEGESDYLRQQIYLDENGNYFFAAKGGANATIGFETSYPLNGREVLIPVRQEALAVWAQDNLCGKEYERALEEFKLPKIKYETIWLYQQGHAVSLDNFIYEFLWKTNNGFYMLHSTKSDYPCFGYHTPLIDCQYEIWAPRMYIYYVTPETARRWAEARGMSEAACQKVFEH